MRQILALIAVLAIAGPLSAAEPVDKVRAEVLSVSDGDTVTLNIHLPWNLTIRGEAIRALGYDAWETSRRRQSRMVTDAELEKGKAAKAALVTLLATGELFIVPEGEGERDPYGRILARLHVRQRDGKWVDVADFMKRRGHDRGDAP